MSTRSFTSQKLQTTQSLLALIVDNPSISDEVFGLHAQQAIEKLLKALLTVLDVRVKKTHDLGWLMDCCANAGHPLPENLAVLDLLTPYSVTGRYEDVPFKHPFTRNDLQTLIQDLRLWVESRI